MKNIFKKLGTFALTLVVMISMVTSVFAATQGRITLSTGKHDVDGATFSVYKMMDATTTADGNSATYTIADDFIDFFVKKIAELDTNVTDEQAYNYVKTHVKTTEFQSSVKKYIIDKKLGAVEELTREAGKKEYTTQKALDLGYYVIISSNEEFTPIFTTVAKANQDVYLKGKTPDVDKKVDGNDWTSAQVGDIIHFTVESMVPNMTGFDTYTFKLTDTMSEGLTVTEGTLSLKVIIDNTELAKDQYTVEVDGQNITIEIKDFIQYKEQANEPILFEYDAVLNKTAFREDKETNTANVHYGNNPENLTSGTPDTVVVRTYDLTIKKTNEDASENLAGAEFELYRGTDTTGTPIKFVDLGAGKYRVATNSDLTTTTLVSPDGGDSVKGIITVSGLDADEYQLVEIKAPDGYNKLTTPTTIAIGATSNDNGQNVIVSDNNITVHNSKGSLLPETGGMGTVLFTIVGGAGILAVLYSFMKSNKKNALNENK